MSDYITSLAIQIRDLVPDRATPDHPQELRLFRAYAVLALVRGPDVTREDVHHAWVAWMAELDPNHPALVQFSALGAADQEQDAPFVRAIAAVAAGLTEVENS